VRGKDAADRQPISHVRVGHQGARHRHGQLARVPHLLQCVRLQTASPDLIWRITLARAEDAGFRRVFEQLVCEGPIDLVVDEVRGRCGKTREIGSHGIHAAFRGVGALQNPLGRFSAGAGGDADCHEIPCLHVWLGPL
jgi:hypothetical protein